MTRYGRTVGDPAQWEAMGAPDPLTRAEREAMASRRCNECGALLLIVEVGPHYRARHPERIPSVTLVQR